MNYKSIAKNYAIALVAQGVSTCASIATGFILPKVLGVSEYGYYQLFVFYTTYVGLCHLGLTDGVYLICGGISKQRIDNDSLKSQMFFGIAYELIFSIILILYALTARINSERSNVFMLLSIYLIIKNTGAYLGYILQAINETRLFSLSTIVEKSAFVSIVVILMYLGVDSYMPYAVAFTVGTTFQMIYCITYTKPIIFARFLPIEETIAHVRESISAGSKLLIANLASSLVLGVARLAIDDAWGIETFSKVSFTLSLVTFFLTFITQASMVLFPALRTGNSSDIKKFYYVASTLMGIIFPIGYLLYTPICWFVYSWLPAYNDSIRYLILLLPVCVFDSKMNITCTTLYKVRREESKLLKINLITLVMCVLLVGISVYGLKSIEITLAATTLTVILRGIYAEYDLSRKLGIRRNDISVWEVILTIVFVVTALYCSYTKQIVIYLFTYIVFITLHKNLISNILFKFK